MAGRSRQINKVVENGSLPENTSYCRRCRTIKSTSEFGKAVDFTLDVSGFFSVCKNCMNELFAQELIEAGDSVEKATLAMCRKLNIRFDNRAVDATLTQIQTKGSDPTKFFTLYRAKILVTSRTSVKDTSTSVDLTYQFNDENIIKIDESKFLDTDYQDMDELRKFWGKGFEPEEIMILEEKFASYSQTNAIDTHPERVLLKYICLKEYEIDRAMDGGGKGSTANLTKEYQELLKSANISPSSATAASGGKSQETWGMFIKTIEETEPAEYFKDDSLFKDYDNVNRMWTHYILRSIKNFITGSRDFNVEDIESDYEDEDDIEEPTTPLEYKAED